MVTPSAYVIQSSKDSSFITDIVAAAVVVIATLVAVLVLYKCQVLQKLNDWHNHRTEIHIPEMITNNHRESTPLNEYRYIGAQNSGSSYPITGYQRTDQMSGFTDIDEFSGDDPSANQIESRCTETTGLLSTGQSSRDFPIEPNQDLIEIVNESNEFIPKTSESAEENCTTEDSKCFSNKIIPNTSEHFSLNCIQSKLDIQIENHSLEADFKDLHSSDCKMEDDSALTDHDKHEADDNENERLASQGGSCTSEWSGSTFNATGYKDVSRMSLSNFDEVSDLDSGVVGYKETFSDSDLDATSSMLIVRDHLQDTFPDPNRVRKDSLSYLREEDGCKSDNSIDTTLRKALSSSDFFQVSTVETSSHSAPSYMQAGNNKDSESSNPRLLSKMAEKHDIQLNDKTQLINGHVNNIECMF